MRLQPAQILSSADNKTGTQYINKRGGSPNRPFKYWVLLVSLARLKKKDKNVMKNNLYLLSCKCRKHCSSFFPDSSLRLLCCFNTLLSIKQINKPWELETICASALVCLFTFVGRTVFPADSDRGPLEYSLFLWRISVLIKDFNLPASPCCSFSAYEAH